MKQPMVLLCSEALQSNTQWGLKKSQIRRLSDYRVTLVVLQYGNCISRDGRIRKNVGLYHRGVGLERCWITEVLD